MRWTIFISIVFAFLSRLGAETIPSYHVTIAAESNGTVHVQEELLYDFQASFATGFVRILPLINNQSQFQIVGKNDRSIVANMHIEQDGQPMLFAVQEDFTGKFGPMLRIIFGTPGRYFSGKHHYILSYTLDNAIHLIAYGKKIALRWDLPSTERRATIEHFSIEVTLPKDWDRSQVTLQGNIGALPLQSSQLFWKSPNTFYIEAASLAPNEPITIEATHPAKSLPKRLSTSTPLANIAIGYLSPFVLLGIYLLWLRYLKRRYKPASAKRRSLPVRYNPPKGLSFLQSVYLYGEGLRRYDIFPAIIDLAQKGFVKIEQIFDSITLQKIQDKDTSTLSADERYLLEGLLFPLETTSCAIEHKSIAERQVMRDKFSTLIDKLNNWAVNEGYLLQKPPQVRRDFFIQALVIALPIIGLLNFSFLFLMSQSDGTQLFVAMLFFNLCAQLAAFVIYLIILTLKKRSIGGAVIALFFLWLLILFGRLFLSPTCTSAMDVLLCPHIWTYWLIVYLLFHEGWSISPYTAKGLQIREHMEGFRQFISDVESIRLQQMLRENPLYIDRHLPYALYFEDEKS